MKSLGVYIRQAGRMGAAVALLVATLLPALVPSLVSAAQATERSIALSSSSKGASGVNYTVNFKPAANAGAFVVDFCSNSPIIGQSCTTPSGFSVGTPSSTTSGFTDVAEVTNDSQHHTLRVTGSMTAGTAVSVDISGLTNPSAAGPLYARILTYANATDANGYLSAAPDTVGNHIDDGGVAISITDTVGVSGAVLESMTFCAAKVSITDGCANASANTPVLKLGEVVGSTVALDPSAISTGDVFAQISTNAVGGAIVSLKSGVACGGLKRAEANSSTCDIAPATTGGITAGQARFGLMASSLTDTGTGTFQPSNGYDNTTYKLNWVSGNATGVSSPYGDQVLDTNSGPTSNKNAKLTFGASISSTTPAGLYSADLSLIATGKF